MRVIALLTLSARVAFGAVYYADFDAGSDSNGGTSTGAAFKHCPGDANATGTAASTSLAAGDTVIFKGGIRYFGNVVIGASGTLGNPITFDGNSSGAWGTGRAIIDCSTSFSPSWTQCTDSADAGGNANFANIYWTTVPSGVTNGWPQLIYNGTNQTHTAQFPNPTNRFLFDIVSSWTSVTAANIGPTSITDTAYFTQSSATDWDEAWIGAWTTGNAANFRRMTNFNTATDTVKFSPAISQYTDRDSYYCMLNHPRLIDQPGEHAVSTNQNRIYVWPPGSMNPSTLSWSVGTYKAAAFSGYGRSYIAVRNFVIQGIYSAIDAGGGNADGIAVDFLTGSNNKVEGCDIRLCKNMDRDWLVSMGSHNAAFASNSVARSFAGGVRAGGGTNIFVSTNYFKELTGTAIYFTFSTNSFCSSNVVDTLLGTHANGVSFYQSCDYVTISHNRIRNAVTLLTYEDGKNFSFIGNVIDAVGLDQRINEWGGVTGTNYWVGNSLVNCSAGRILNCDVSGVASVYIIINNIIDGGGSGAATEVRFNNVYTSRHWWQDSGYGWSLSTGETDQTAADLFVTAGSDFHLASGSPAIDAGTNRLSQHSIDLDGVALDSVPDLGAWQFRGIADNTPRTQSLRTMFRQR